MILDFAETRIILISFFNIFLIGNQILSTNNWENISFLWLQSHFQAKSKYFDDSTWNQSKIGLYIYRNEDNRNRWSWEVAKEIILKASILHSTVRRIWRITACKSKNIKYHWNAPQNRSKNTKIWPHFVLISCMETPFLRMMKNNSFFRKILSVRLVSSALTIAKQHQLMPNTPKWNLSWKCGCRRYFSSKQWILTKHYTEF